MVWVAFALASIVLCVWVVRPLLPSRRRKDPNPSAAHEQALEKLRGSEEENVSDGAGEEEVAVEGSAFRSNFPASRGLTRPSLHIAAAVVILVPAIALALYAWIGSPGLPDAPFAQRLQAQNPADQDRAARFEAVLAEVRERPDDPDSWLAAGRMLLVAGRAELAVRLLAQAVKLAPERRDILEIHGEALVGAANGKVTSDALDAFEKVLALHPANPRARHYLALADYQAGRLTAALERWSSLAGDAPPDAPWLALVETRIRQTAKELGLEASDWLPSGQPPQPPAREDEKG